MNLTIMSSKISKKEYRDLFLATRQALTLSRRKEASLKARAQLPLLFKGKEKILSFSSLPQEIDLWEMNAWLANMNRLVLPKVAGETLLLFEVTDLGNQLKISKWNIWEPDPSLCAQIPIDDVACVLVPGLAFDARNARLGYGKGHYDRLLQKGCLMKLGVGFLEQFSLLPLPTDEHDQFLNALHLF